MVRCVPASTDVDGTYHMSYSSSDMTQVIDNNEDVVPTTDKGKGIGIV
jgi:hypothetical protein